MHTMDCNKRSRAEEAEGSPDERDPVRHRLCDSVLEPGSRCTGAGAGAGAGSRMASTASGVPVVSGGLEFSGAGAAPGLSGIVPISGIDRVGLLDLGANEAVHWRRKVWERERRCFRVALG